MLLCSCPAVHSPAHLKKSEQCALNELEENNWSETLQEDTVVAHLIEAIVMAVAQFQKKIKVTTRNQQTCPGDSVLYHNNVPLLFSPGPGRSYCQSPRPYDMEEEHYGVHKMFWILAEQVVCVGLFQLIEQVFQQCVVCSVSKGAGAQILPPTISPAAAPSWRLVGSICPSGQGPAPKLHFHPRHPTTTMQSPLVAINEIHGGSELIFLGKYHWNRKEKDRKPPKRFIPHCLPTD